jgi:hypothetical protein
MTYNTTIDLDEVRTPRTSGLLSGRDNGEAARNRFGVSKMDSGQDEITVVIPDEVFSMNTSFFLGLFGPSVRALGEEGFRKKFKFRCDEQVHRPTIERGIENALKHATIFPEKKTAA